jgi:hypothetical protein
MLMFAKYLIAVMSQTAFYAPVRILIYALIVLHLITWLVMDKFVIKSFAKIPSSMIRVFRLVNVQLEHFYPIANVLVVQRTIVFLVILQDVLNAIKDITLLTVNVSTVWTIVTSAFQERAASRVTTAMCSRAGIVRRLQVNQDRLILAIYFHRLSVLLDVKLAHTFRVSYTALPRRADMPSVKMDKF